jgi:hypothetical protein
MAATGRAALSLDIEVQGVRELERELGNYPGEALATLKRRTKEIAKDLLAHVRAAGRADSKQSARAAATLRLRTSRGGATIVAGPHPLLFGSEFGMDSRSGWFSASRYRNSQGRQFRPHRGQSSYWLFRSAEEHQPQVEAAFRSAVDQIVRDFRPG